MSSRCVLRSLDSGYCDVVVWNSEPVILGRTRDTTIKDTRCSKKQVEVCCNLSEQSCRVVQLGGNASAVDGTVLQRGAPVIARHGQVIEVLASQYKYKIDFDRAPTKIEGTCEISDSIDKVRRTETRNTSKNNNIGNLKQEQSKVTSTCVDIKNKDSRGVLAVSKIPVRNKEEQVTEVSSSHVPAPNMAPRKKTGGAAKRPATEAPEPAAPPIKKAKLGGWSSVDGGELRIYNAQGLRGSSKIASYDMDSTLIVTQSGKVFAQNYNDWKIMFSEVPGKLKSLHAEGHKIVLFTNQAGIGTGKHTAVGIQNKIANVIARLGVPAQAFVATGKGRFRKPSPEMWNHFVEHCNEGVAVDMADSVYVGDAAGRPAVQKQRKKDHSSADRLYALNLQLPFQTPEEHFLGRRTEKYEMPEFDPRSLSVSSSEFEPANTVVPANTPELVVLVGFPGSGKTVLATRILAKLGYRHVNRDSIGTWQKCVAEAQKQLKAGESVVVDNTNPDRESRSRYIKVAAELNVPVRCFLLNVSKDHSRHNNKFRELTDTNHSRVSDMIFNMYNSKFQQPEKSEGFTDIVKVNFIPKFKNKAEEKLYKLFLLEK